ncbi:bifunctional diaminohydroxyphosphoribosylaminopyrimidine deaminase/5-amino-6-(5-phosphoribosylamino)uracil reductase RibD [Peribacillus butanolivorans]|uniref:bifunctional diaminohydroxyphosphoribosylaminopyrimidine deaminase/5-amino-6-(5-phosphoribosylamino)uracil reductase RibD n=1 Tax=Peribacillus TaxID=2675229 RepID=UPI000701FBBA|nr:MULTISPECIES: bifunctional diaminohydroxyphosphoribosylaminopyrimidine deaminase/5-amino-6-(5-phosphoribosylamino)uracil reductase RibD [unclassified Peribacillus]KQU20413.1 bifunctional diaminohydroxyphosphoribosylaminopyrimidine deaminase/5-amino-6-(5-phosphoribosylamino)uracil reductase [Bacillus sp. Leaf13]KRF67140.1 bifunctional diaminohydroxyphosphoribosylaminopyrimidine deaminase/5-amino-6-(5-phosphoribosylamino)uracil reductase [Bacillus sp. Soil768D1]MBK5443793.1 bifunctional diamino
MNNDQYYMKLALDLAASAKGKTNPNPVVGAVIVKDGVIAGTGIHRKAGEPHAEVHAFKMAGDYAKDATLYVTLEPCSHYGKTPPCANLVKESGVRRVVVATQDPNPEVAGRGISILRDAGIEVEVGVLEKEAQRLNERFIHNMITNRPFVISKYAMTLDGKLATHTGHSKWITGEESRHSVHLLRDEVDAILIGIGTVLADNPSLTTRLPEGGGKNPIRIILDSELRVPLDANVVQVSDAKTVIVTQENASVDKIAALSEKGIEFIIVPKTDAGLDLRILMEELYKKGITDVLLEGGSEVNASFLRAGLIDKYLIYVAPKLLGGRNSLTPFSGINVDTMDEAMDVSISSVDMSGEDICIIAYPK